MRAPEGWAAKCPAFEPGESLSEARRLGHFHNLVIVLSFAYWMEWVANSPRQVEPYAEEMFHLASEHGFPIFSGLAATYRGWSSAALGKASQGVSFLTEGLALVRATGTVMGTTVALTMLADACAKSGQAEESLQRFAEAGRIIETNDERYGEAEFCRLRGRLLNGSGNRTAAERNYHQALAVAQRQNARLWELRTATSLAGLWCDQGKRAEARDVLAPVYGWFTEGLDTPVLKEAKALLDELAS
jgi:predicted ATPase